MNKPHHICMVSYEYGSAQGAEGICTRRLAEALAAAGWQVTVLTSRHAGADSDRGAVQVRRIATQPWWPAALWRPLAALLRNWRLQGADYHLFWQYRVAREVLPADVTLVYGRAMPLSGCLAARRLAARNGLPLFIHFSDPVLSPWFVPPPMPLRVLKHNFRKLVTAATGISFVTAQALRYCESAFGIPLAQKSFLLPHVAPAPFLLGAVPDAGRPILLYAGKFYGRRTPESLLAGFAQFLKEQPSALFRFLGSQPESVLPVAERLGIAASVEVLPFAADVAPHFRAAHVLVALDSFEGAPLFMSTKLIEYLVTDRPVLLLSPPDSPAAELVGQFPETARCTGEAPGAIAGALRQLLAPADPSAMQRRHAAMHDYSPMALAARFGAEVAARLGTAQRGDNA